MGTILMKTINTYINEKLRLTNKRTYSCQPKGKQELQQIIIKRIKNEGPTCDLNDIDVSKITNMSQLFDASINSIFKDFNGDISMWDVSNVKSMRDMFNGCEKFNCDLSKWNVSNVKDMSDMFYGCKKFNQDLDSWNVSNVKNMDIAFKYCPTKPKWYDKDK
jgi:surface protein